MSKLLTQNIGFINNHLTWLGVLILFAHPLWAYDQKIGQLFAEYPKSTAQLAHCLMTVEQLKSEMRAKEFIESKPVIFNEGNARFFVSKALELEFKAKELGIINDSELLVSHMNSIYERTQRPELMQQITDKLSGFNVSLERCIAMPDLIKQIELETDEEIQKEFLMAQGSIDPCAPVSQPVNIPVRKHPSIVATGTELIVWGGRIGDEMSQTGMVYDFLTDSWSLMEQTGDIPTARWGARTVWSGSEMLIYGGTERSNSIATDIFNGARYNPSNHTWTEMSSVGTPEMVSGTMVMVGSTLVLWGDSFQNSGRYYPNSDIWDTMTSINFPPQRFAHTAVSTGAHMLVHGGRSGTTFFNDFWRYTPNQNSWVQLTTPSSTISPPRADHSAVWTGTDMIVWGGKTTGFESITKGAKYNLNANSWSAISASGAPSKRSNHGSAWTGDEMIIWAGVDSFVYRGGAAYDPSDNSWTALPFGDTSTRFKFFSGWTGSEYVAFDNSVTSNNLKAGDVYSVGSNSWRQMATTFPQNNPVVEAYWVMDEFDSSSISSPDGKRVLDICGDKDGRIDTSNSPQLTTSGVLSNTTAISFDSGSDKLEYLAGYGFSDGGPSAGGEIDFASEESMSLEAMVRIPEDFTALGSIVEKDAAGSGTFWYLFVNNGFPFARVSDGVNTTTITANTSINDNQWHQVALVRDDDEKTLSIYVDYELDAQISNIATEGSVTASATPVSIAGIADLGNGQLSGDVDFIRISKGVVPVTQMTYADRVVDLSVSLSSEGVVVPGGVVVFRLTVSNSGPTEATDVSVINEFNADFISATWTCVASSNASCSASGSGDISDSAGIPSGENVVYTILATLNSFPDYEIENSAAVLIDESVNNEFNVSNNTATVTLVDEIFRSGFE